MEGECSASTFTPNIEYIRKKRGIGGVEAVLKVLNDYGYDYTTDRFRGLTKVPVDLRRDMLFAARDALGWDDEQIKDMGYNAPKVSFVLKFFIGMFGNVKRIFEHAPEMWRKHYTVGRLRKVHFEQGRIVIAVEDFDLDPLVCKYLEGYFRGVSELAPVGKVGVAETKCTFRGDERHEYELTWDA